nr:HipA domain-containing protein [Muribaculaceae bacterium]
SGMGALTYAPVSNILTGQEIDDFDLLQQKALEVLRERQDNDAELLLFNSGNSGGARPKAVFSDAAGHWLVKFRHTYDPKDIGLQEYSYNEIARKCGISVPDFKLVNGKYFASRRFDIAPSGERIHTATAGGLLCISLGNPILDYSNLLALTGFLTQNPMDVEEMYRRMVFNYLTDNKDDHCKNFSFLVSSDSAGKWKWQLAPAYDLTLCAEGYNGEHATSVNGTGHPTIADFIAVGTKIKLSEPICRRIIEEVADNCGPLLCYSLK